MIQNPMIQAVATGMSYPAQQSGAPAGPGGFQEAIVLQAPSSSSSHHQLLAGAAASTASQNQQQTLRVNHPPSMNTTSSISVLTPYQSAA